MMSTIIINFYETSFTLHHCNQLTCFEIGRRQGIDSEYQYTRLAACTLVTLLHRHILQMLIMVLW
jgi:hypothetical protein